MEFLIKTLNYQFYRLFFIVDVSRFEKNKFQDKKKRKGGEDGGEEMKEEQEKEEKEKEESAVS